MRRNKLTAILTGIIAASLLAGCGSGTGASSASSNGTAAASSAAATSEAASSGGAGTDSVSTKSSSISSGSSSVENDAAASSSAAPQGDGYTFKYVVNNIGEVVTADIALELGNFEKEGINVKNIGIAGGGAVTIEDVSGGDADFGDAAIPAYVNSIAAGSKIKVVYGGPAIAHENDPGYRLIVAKDSDINSPEDLKGKTIAVGARGAMWEFTARLYLENAGIDADSVNYLVVPITQHEQVLKSGQVDAVVDGVPIGDQIIEDGVGREIGNLYKDLGKEGQYGWGYIVNTDVIKEHPDGVRRLVKALEETDEWVEANPEKARDLVSKVLEERDQDGALARYWHPFKLYNHGLWSDEHVNFWLDYMKKEGTIDSNVNLKPSDIYTNEFNPYYKG